MSTEDKLAPHFWEERYQNRQTGWDIGEPAPPFVDYLAEPEAPAPGRILVPGSGRGHDALLFARHGFEVVGVDFAPSAVEYSRARAAEENLSEKTSFIQSDLFKLPDEYLGSFDYAAEHTCFCAIDPGLRPNYVRVIHQLLKPGGLLIAVFFAHNREGGPPFRTSAAEVRQLFSPLFNIERLHPAKRSHRQRANEELFGLLRKKNL